MESLLIRLSSALHGDLDKSTLKYDPQQYVYLPVDKTWYIKTIQYILPHNIYNVSASKGNNKFTYDLSANPIDGGSVEEVTVTLVDAIYDTTLLKSAIDKAFEVNGDYIPGTTSADPKTYPFTIDFNFATSHSFIQSIDSDYKIDFSAGGTSSLHDLIGFNAGVLTGNTSYYSQSDADFWGAQATWFIHCNLAQSLGGDQFSDILCSGTWTAGPNQIQFGPTLPSWANVLIPIQDGMSRLSTVQITITDSDNVPLKFTGTALDSNVEIVIQILAA